jgi:hypothetical protein
MRWVQATAWSAGTAAHMADMSGMAAAIDSGLNI